MVVRLFAAVRSPIRRSAIRAATATITLAFCWGVPAEVRGESLPAVGVRAVGDGVRVNPETGLYFEDRTDVHADYPTGDYRSRNPVWDAGDARISLHAARNEFVSFQVVVDSVNPVSRVNLRVGNLRGPGRNRRRGPIAASWPFPGRQGSAASADILTERPSRRPTATGARAAGSRSITSCFPSTPTGRFPSRKRTARTGPWRKPRRSGERRHAGSRSISIPTLTAGR